MMLFFLSGESSWQQLASMSCSAQDGQRVPGTQTERGLGPDPIHQAEVETLSELQAGEDPGR